jgi:hypothetical protein
LLKRLSFRQVEEQTISAPGGVRQDWNPVPRPLGAVMLGVAALAASFGFFGMTWGTTWTDLTPTGRRAGLGLALFGLLFPACWALAGGIERLSERAWPARRMFRQVFSPLAWLAGVLGIWLGSVYLVGDRSPQFLIPTAFIAVSGLLALPLWTIPHRPGLSLARAIHHAGLTAWLLACHLPFTQLGV